MKKILHSYKGFDFTLSVDTEKGHTEKLYHDIYMGNERIGSLDDIYGTTNSITVGQFETAVDKILNMTFDKPTKIRYNPSMNLTELSTDDIIILIENTKMMIRDYPSAQSFWKTMLKEYQTEYVRRELRNIPA